VITFPSRSSVVMARQSTPHPCGNSENRLLMMPCSVPGYRARKLTSNGHFHHRVKAETIEK